MKDMTIRTKILGFVVASALVVLGAMGSLTYVVLASQGSSQRLVTGLLANAHASQDLVGAAAKLQDATLRMLRTKDVDALENLIKQADTAGAEAGSLVRGKSELAAALSVLTSANAKSRDALLKGEAGQANEMFLSESNPAFQKLLERIDRSQGDALNALDAEGKKTMSRLRGLGIGVCVTAGLLSLGLVVVGLFLAGGIGTSIRRIVERVRDVAEGEGDLTRRLPEDSGDELGDLSRSFNTFMDKLHGIMARVQAHTGRLASACEQMAAATVEQARTMDAQRGQSDQVAAAMQQISITVGDVSQNTQDAAEASQNAAEIARDGGSVVEQAIAKMRMIAESVGNSADRVHSLGQSSDRIGQIVAVIDDIADQTNLLALNAAIEAARAGEQGRGFAVVADEVRKLAERTGKATKEISTLVGQIQTETKLAVSAMHTGTCLVGEGVEATRKAGSSLAGIIDMSDKVGAMISQIATAVTQQATSTGDVNANIEQIAQMTSEVANTAAQSAQSVTELSELASDLQGIVGNFKLA